jgi:hypothetical protein
MSTMGFMDKFKTKPQNAPPPRPDVAQARTPKSKEWFVKITGSQMGQLLKLDHVCWPLFTILQFESFRHRGKPFVLPADMIAAQKGLSKSNQRKALRQLEACRLIAVIRNPNKPPAITVSKPPLFETALAGE